MQALACKINPCHVCGMIFSCEQDGIPSGRARLNISFSSLKTFPLQRGSEIPGGRKLCRKPSRQGRTGSGAQHAISVGRKEDEMSSFIAKPAEVERKWYVVDAEGLTLGRLASEVASVLRGKHKPTFTPHVDVGDFVVVVNASKVVLTGKKLDQKVYRHHSGYIGGMKETSARVMMENKPEQAMFIAVKGMLPHNSLGRQMVKKLRVYAGSEHENIAQKPEVWEVK